MSSISTVQIKVRLSAEGAAIVGSEWAVLDLQPGFSPRVSKDVNALSDANKLIADGVLPMSVPFSTTNDAAFMSLSSPIITDNEDSGIEARVVVDSHEFPFDRLWVRSKNDTSKSWEIEFRRSPNHWMELASKKTLCSIDMGEATLSATEVAALSPDQIYVEGEAVHRWPIIDYGGWVDLSLPDQFTDPPIKRVFLEDLRPIISRTFLLKQGFCEIGWTLEGALYDTDFANARFDYLLSREYYTQSKGGGHKLIGLSLSDMLIGSWPIFASPIMFEQVEYDPGSEAIPAGSLFYAGITNNLPFEGIWKFCISGVLENTGIIQQEVLFHVFDFDTSTLTASGEVLYYDDDPIVLSPGQNTYIKICRDVKLKPGQTALFYTLNATGIILKKGYRFTFEPANKSLVRGDVVELNKLVDCELNFLDYIKGEIHQINGRVETDFTNRIVRIHPYRTSMVGAATVQGFIKDGEAPIDIDAQIVCDSIQLSRQKNTLTRYTRIQYKDSTDAYIDSLDLPEPPHSRKVLNGVELEDKVTDLKNPFFEPTLNGRPTVLKYAKNIGDQKTKPMPFLPRLWDNTEGNRSFVIGPRSLLYFGEVSQIDPETGLECAFFFEGGVATTDFAFACMVPEIPFGTEPTIDGNLAYGVRENDLYVTFYLGFLQRQKRGIYIDALVLMSATNYNTWDFRTPFFFFYNGRPVKALAEGIRDFAPALNIPTPMRFLVEPSDTQCCDLPCSCRFKECNYYQDFGQYITQDTLDALSITSFKVNGVEQLISAVDFGIINVVEVGGRHYVTNLVDALASIGVDYFTFSYSTKEYADKPDGRYFKIKWPSCWSFEIIISDGEAQVYRYRDFDMAQQWFDATWEAMGYSGNPVSEPQDCVITNEY